MLSLNLINHVLKQNPHVCHDLAGYNGIVVGIQAGSLNVIGRINEHGLLAQTHHRPDTILIVHHQAWSKFIQGQSLDFNDLAIEGDMEIGMNILLRCVTLRYFPQEDLRCILGNETLERIVYQANTIGQILQTIGRVVSFQTNDVSKTSQVNWQEQFNTYQRNLAQLHEQLAQTNRRLDALEQRFRQPE